MVRKVHKVAPPLTPEHPWERQPGERDGAWSAFVAYRDMPPGERTIRKAAAATGRQKPGCGALCSVWDWVARVAAYDAWKDKQSKALEPAAPYT